VTTLAAPEGGSVESSSAPISDNARSPKPTSNTEASKPDHSQSTDFEAATVLPQVLKIAGTIVAPTTLLTALLFYFGLMYAIGYFRYFGVNWTVLNLPLQDYLLLSASGGIIPLVYAAGVMLLGLWLYQLPLDMLSTRAQRVMLAVLLPSAAIAGLFLLGVAMVDVWYPVLGMNFPQEGRGLSLSIGVLLLAYAARLRRRLSAKRRSVRTPPRVPVGMVIAKWGTVFILVSVGLFWAVSSYAVNAGEAEARGLAVDLPCETDVAIYSEKSLNIQTPSVRESTRQSADSAYPFRYDNLKLVPQSGNMYLFLPAGWTHEKGTAILLPRSDKIRLEFSRPAGVQNEIC